MEQRMKSIRTRTRTNWILHVSSAGAESDVELQHEWKVNVVRLLKWSEPEETRIWTLSSLPVLNTRSPEVLIRPQRRIRNLSHDQERKRWLAVYCLINYHFPGWFSASYWLFTDCLPLCGRGWCQAAALIGCWRVKSCGSKVSWLTVSGWVRLLPGAALTSSGCFRHYLMIRLK